MLRLFKLGFGTSAVLMTKFIIVYHDVILGDVSGFPFFFFPEKSARYVILRERTTVVNMLYN